jgi:secondary thiamine-phosphate synthase enzyme
MVQTSIAAEPYTSQLRVHHHSIHLKTEYTLQFIDLTDAIVDSVTQSGVLHGWVNIQSQHTTTAIVVNEHEPLLLEDMRTALECVASSERKYRHDDFKVRTVNMQPDEQANGHAHCKALFLRTSETLNIVHGRLMLGRWQSIFFIELDRSRDRTISVMVMGEARA